MSRLPRGSHTSPRRGPRSLYVAWFLPALKVTKRAPRFGLRRQMFLQERDRAAPRESGRLFVVACRVRVVVERVVRAFIHVLFVHLVVRFEGGLVVRDARIDALIERRVVEKERRRDLR